MATRREGFYVEMGPEFQRVANALREIDAKGPSRMRAKMKQAATPIVADVRAAALSLPARGVKHTGLRARLAKSVSVQASVGNNARVRFVTRMNNPSEAMLPRGEDSGNTGWRHPVYGNQDNWVHQRGGSWFRETIEDDGDLVERRLTDVLEEFAQQVADAGH